MKRESGKDDAVRSALRAGSVDAWPKRRRGWLRRVLRAGASLGVIYLAWAGTACGIQERLIFPRHAIPPGAVLAGVPAGVEEIRITTASGVEAVGWLALPTRNTVGKFPLAVWFHGNAEVIDQIVMSAEVADLRRRGLAVLLVEYPGYGRAPGSPSERGIVEAGMALVEAVSGREGIDAERVVYFGRSLGGGAACGVADRRPPRALVLITTFTSVASFARGMWVPEWMVRHPFRNDEVLSRLDVPVLIMHGDHDEIVPASHGRALAKVARRGALWEDRGAGHLDFPRDWEGYTERLGEFLREAGVSGE